MSPLSGAAGTEPAGRSGGQRVDRSISRVFSSPARQSAGQLAGEREIWKKFPTKTFKPLFAAPSSLIHSALSLSVSIYDQIAHLRAREAIAGPGKSLGSRAMSRWKTIFADELFSLSYHQPAPRTIKPPVERAGRLTRPNLNGCISISRD